ncbi:GNAT family N-acetyltransferase [Paenibacillus sp. N1-5-1-14]|uniref:GNAT family N-acetyltransferase n=1 Tax=Paenibacillus radicibacter TaxID=2972488 RepID=UPI0021591F55|nr:GNAT family N-acetyltransferase [Paenibacillus radicibacter]MCR8644414.1 GNAT family N-acetyltransferase [Paenibacillus radicibacter]
MIIQKLEVLTLTQLQGLGQFGYEVTQQYEVMKEAGPDYYAIRMTLKDVASPYMKHDSSPEEDYIDYEEMVRLGFSYGAFDGDRLAGIVIAKPEEWNNTLLIWHLHVHEDYRRQSVAKQLIERIVEQANAHHFRAVALETQNTNVQAIAFYMKCGFELEGIDTSLYDASKIGRDEVALYMRKRIDET